MLLNRVNDSASDLFEESRSQHAVHRRGGAYFHASDGTRLHYTDEAKTNGGGPVLLVHGTAQSGWMWQAPSWCDTAATLARHGYRPVTIDLRGMGMSDLSNDTSRYGGARVCQDMVELLDHLGIRRAHVLGFSLGGYLLGPLVVRYPDRIASATLAGAQFRREAEDLARRAAGLNKMFESDFFKRRNLSTDEMGALHAMSTEAHIRSQVVTEAQMKSLQVPIYAIAGGSDSNGYPLQPGHTMARYQLLEHTSHLEIVTHPQFAQHVLSFLAKHPIGAQQRARLKRK